MSAQQERQEDGRIQVTTARPPPWRDERVLRVVIQVVFVLAVVGLVYYLSTNLLTNMRRQGMRTDFGFLFQPAGFTLTGTDFSSRDPVWIAIGYGLWNTVIVSAWGIVLATILGVFVGVARLSTNWLVRKCAGAFVEALRNVPLLVLLFFLYFAVLQQLPRISEPLEPAGLFVLSNRGLYVPWLEFLEAAAPYLIVLAVAAVAAVALGWWRTRQFDRTGQPHHRILWGAGVFVVLAALAWLVMDQPVGLSMPVREGRLVEGGKVLSVEHGALLFGLTIYMAAFIAEIVRGSILAVPRGQTEAANALGLRAFERLRFVVLPQAMRIAVPPTGNEFINLAKNSALGIAIAFPELLRVSRIAIGQGMPAPQLIAIMAVIYLAVSLSLSLVTNIINRRLALRGD